MTNGSLDTGVAGRIKRPRRLPMAASTENGTRNLTEAAIHSQYRARAWLALSAKASSTATAANPVDCHKWLAAKRPKEAANSGVGIASSFLRQLAEGLARFLHIFQSELAGIDQVRHDGLGPAAEEAQQVIDQLALGGLAGHKRFENMGVANLPDAADGFLPFHPINSVLHRRVGGPAFRGEELLNVPNAGWAEGPKGLHDSQFQSG